MSKQIIVNEDCVRWLTKVGNYEPSRFLKTRFVKKRSGKSTYTTLVNDPIIVRWQEPRRGVLVDRDVKFDIFDPMYKNPDTVEFVWGFESKVAKICTITYKSGKNAGRTEKVVLLDDKRLYHLKLQAILSYFHEVPVTATKKPRMTVGNEKKEDDKSATTTTSTPVVTGTPSSSVAEETDDDHDSVDDLKTVDDEYDDEGRSHHQNEGIEPSETVSKTEEPKTEPVAPKLSPTEVKREDVDDDDDEVVVVVSLPMAATTTTTTTSKPITAKPVAAKPLAFVNKHTGEIVDLSKDKEMDDFYEDLLEYIPIRQRIENYKRSQQTLKGASITTTTTTTTTTTSASASTTATATPSVVPTVDSKTTKLKTKVVPKVCKTIQPSTVDANMLYADIV